MSNKTTSILFFIFTILFSLVIPLITLKNGIELTHDSGYYVQSAKAFADSGHFLDIHGNRLTLYPPGYSLWLSAYIYSGMSISTFAIWSNTLFYFLTLLLVAFIIRRSLQNNNLKLIAFISIGLSTALIQNGVFLWSDLLFIVFTVAYLAALASFLETKNGMAFFGMIVFTIFSFYIRYIGLALLLSTFLSILFSSDFSFGEKVKNIISYGIYTSFFAGIWLVRNYIVSGTFSMEYDPGEKTLLENIKDAGSIIATYFIPNNTEQLYKLITVAIIFVLSILLAIKFRKVIPKSYNALGSFIVAYLGFFIAINTLKDICDFDDRYLSPLAIPVMLSIFILIDIAITNFKFKNYVIILLCIWLIYPTFRLVRNGKQWHEGVGYNSSFWKDNKVLKAMKEKPEELVISNNPIPIILINGYQAFSTDYKENLENTPFYFIEWTDGERLNYLKTDEKTFKNTYQPKDKKSFTTAKVFFHTRDKDSPYMKHIIKY